MGIQYFRLGNGPFNDIAIETTGYDHEAVVMFPSLSKSGVYNVDDDKMLSFKVKTDHDSIDNIVRHDITPDMMPTEELKQMYEDALTEDPAMLWANDVFGTYCPDNSELPATTDIKRTYIGKCPECGKVGVIVELTDGGTWCHNCEYGMKGADRQCLTIGDCKKGNIIVVDGEEWTLQGFTHDGWGVLCSPEKSQNAVMKGDTPCEKA